MGEFTTTCENMGVGGYYAEECGDGQPNCWHKGLVFMNQIINEETHKDIFWDIINLGLTLKTIPRAISDKIDS